ncbi:MAG: hypothetical protein DCC73_09060 [Proteobacteria bacterium]|nr:MAG: hypothetical protein DCC73_09060 [Pseudomonadota bacterium]
MPIYFQAKRMMAQLMLMCCGAGLMKPENWQRNMGAQNLPIGISVGCCLKLPWEKMACGQEKKFAL